MTLYQVNDTVQALLTAYPGQNEFDLRVKVAGIKGKFSKVVATVLCYTQETTTLPEIFSWKLVEAPQHLLYTDLRIEVFLAERRLGSTTVSLGHIMTSTSDHVMPVQWLPIQNWEDPVLETVLVFAKVGAQMRGPGDPPFAESTPALADTNIPAPASQIMSQGYNLKFALHCARELPDIDVGVPCTGAFVTVAVNGLVATTPPATVVDPDFNVMVQLPVLPPRRSDIVRISIMAQEKSKTHFICDFMLSLTDIIENSQRYEAPRWYNLYSEMDQSVMASSSILSVLGLQSTFLSSSVFVARSTYFGRLLMAAQSERSSRLTMAHIAMPPMEQLLLFNHGPSLYTLTISCTKARNLGFSLSSLRIHVLVGQKALLSESQFVFNGDSCDLDVSLAADIIALTLLSSNTKDNELRDFPDAIVHVYQAGLLNDAAVGFARLPLGQFVRQFTTPGWLTLETDHASDTPPAIFLSCTCVFGGFVRPSVRPPPTSSDVSLTSIPKIEDGGGGGGGGGGASFGCNAVRSQIESGCSRDATSGVGCGDGGGGRGGHGESTPA